MKRFKQFIIEGKGRLAPALRWGKEVIGGKPGGAHSDLVSYAATRGKPTEMGFVRKNTGSTDEGPHKGAFFTRHQASQIGKKHPHLLTDPSSASDKPWMAQSYDFKPEGGKRKKKIAEMYSFKQFLMMISEENKKAAKKKPASNKDTKKKFGIANKEATHGGMSFYGPGEL